MQDFFDDHPTLGSFFDLDRDGLLGFGEAAFMGAAAGACIDETERSSRRTERERSFWDDFGDDGDGGCDEDDGE